MEDNPGTIGSMGTGTPTGQREKSNGSAHDSITNINQKAHATLDRASNVATQTADWLSTSQKELTEKSCTYVQANPLRSVGMAFAAGYVLAKLLR